MVFVGVFGVLFVWFWGDGYGVLLCFFVGGFVGVGVDVFGVGVVSGVGF